VETVKVLRYGYRSCLRGGCDKANVPGWRVGFIGWQRASGSEAMVLVTFRLPVLKHVSNTGCAGEWP
jgi:hypothetical protein